MKLPKNALFKPAAPRAETLLDKTTRLAREIIDDDAEKHRLKTARLRKARLEKEAASAEEPTEPPTGARKKPVRKATKR